MPAIAEILDSRFRTAAAAAFGAEFADADPEIRPATKPEFGHFQSNLPMRLAGALKRPPREIAAQLLDSLQIGDICLPPQIAGPGFLNLTLRSDYLAGEVSAIADLRLGVPAAECPQRIIVDYSGPNVAKEMHVGHLRSTIIGDALVRILEFLGHEVIRRNHIGDWGTQFGMSIEHVMEIGADETARELGVGDMNVFYQQARAKFDADPDFVDRARRRVVLLQSGDPETIQLWQLLVDESRRYFRRVYDVLDVRLEPDDDVGESAYNDELADVVDELTGKGLTVESDGATVTFPRGFTGREGAPVPLILRKRDGGFGYDVTDLAAIRERTEKLGGRKLVYITDLGQRMHFEMVFETARAAGWLDHAEATFEGFGLVLGPDRRRLRTRAGDNPKLVDLLTAAVERAGAVIREKAPHLDPVEREAVAKAVGIGAIKYGDLSSDRVKDYVFSLDQMVSFDGNTAPYLQYAHARIRSIFRRGNVDPDRLGSQIVIAEPAEHDLALRLCEFGGVVQRAAEGVELHRICGYLFELASAFTTFYEACPVLKAEPEIRASRLRLCDVTARVLATGLSLLGISAPERM